MSFCKYIKVSKGVLIYTLQMDCHFYVVSDILDQYNSLLIPFGLGKISF